MMPDPKTLSDDDLKSRHAELVAFCDYEERDLPLPPDMPADVRQTVEAKRAESRADRDAYAAEIAARGIG